MALHPSSAVPRPGRNCEAEPVIEDVLRRFAETPFWDGSSTRRPPTCDARRGANETRPYDQAMATASPSPTPNPDATKFTLDTTLPASFNVTNAQAARNNRFAEDVFAAGGVAAIFGVNDFVTVTRQPGADWGPIVAAVQAAAEAHL